MKNLGQLRTEEWPTRRVGFVGWPETGQAPSLHEHFSAACQGRGPNRLILACHVSLDDHLRIESSYSYRAKTATRDGMLKVSDSPGIFVRAVCVLCVALICVMGTVQATHSHPENSTTSHHSCSICATAHVGLNTQTVVSTPVIVTAALASPVAAVSLIFRPTSTQFIRPPPAL